MKSSEVLGIQAVRRALDELKGGVEDSLTRDRLDRIETVLARVAANLARRPGFDAGIGNRPPDRAAAIAWDDRLVRAWEAEVAAFDPRGAAAAAEAGDLSGRLQAYLAQRFDEPGLTVTSARRLPGGRSKHTLVVDLSGTDKLPARVVLRTDSSRTTPHDSVAREYPLIDAVYRAGCPAPEPLWFEADPAVAGAAFIAFAHMPGEPAGNLWGAHDKTGDAARALAGALAQLHLQTVTIAGGAERPARDAVAELFASYRSRWEAARPDRSTIIGDAFAWLEERVDTLSGEARIVHGDAHFSNMLMADGRLVCLLDWEFWHFGHPAEDLAYCRPYVEQTLDWDAFIARYRSAGGPAADAGALDLFAVWRPLRNAVLAATIAHDFVAKEDLDLETAAIALATYPRMEAQVSAALASASATDR